MLSMLQVLSPSKQLVVQYPYLTAAATKQMLLDRIGSYAQPWIDST